MILVLRSMGLPLNSVGPVPVYSFTMTAISTESPARDCAEPVSRTHTHAFSETGAAAGGVAVDGHAQT